MKKNKNIKDKINYHNLPDICFSYDDYKYKKLIKDINKLNEDFQIFLDKNIKKINKPKKNYYTFSINKLFKKLVFDSTKQILKNYKNNFEGNNKRFHSAKEIQE